MSDEAMFRLLTLSRDDALEDRSLHPAFSHAGTVAIIAAEKGIAESEAREKLALWLDGRGTIHDDEAKPWFFTVKRDEWDSLVQRYGTG